MSLGQEKIRIVKNKLASLSKFPILRIYRYLTQTGIDYREQVKKLNIWAPVPLFFSLVFNFNLWTLLSKILYHLIES